MSLGVNSFMIGKDSNNEISFSLNNNLNALSDKVKSLTGLIPSCLKNKAKVPSVFTEIKFLSEVSKLKGSFDISGMIMLQSSQRFLCPDIVPLYPVTNILPSLDKTAPTFNLSACDCSENINAVFIIGKSYFLIKSLLLVNILLAE